MSDRRTPAGAVRTLAVVTHVAHHPRAGRLRAYAPYAREMELWADLVPRLRIVAPRAEREPAMAAAIDRPGVELAAVPASGGPRLRDKARQAILLPVIVGRLLYEMRRADAVHVRCPGNLGLLAVLLAPLVTRRRIAKYAGQWGDYAGEPWSFRLQRRLLRSRWWAAPVTVYGEPRGEPPQVVPFFTSVLGAADLAVAARAAAARAERPPGALRVLFVGRLSAAKNVATLLAAVDAVARAGQAIELTVAGDGEERSALEAMALATGVADRTTFTGGLPFADVLELYVRHDVLVLASATEGWPKAIAEAMAFGMVVIGTDRGLVPSMLAEGRGYVVPPGDVEALRATLEALAADSAADPTRLLPMRRAAAAWASSRSLDDLRLALVELLDRWWGGWRTVVR